MSRDWNLSTGNGVAPSLPGEVWNRLERVLQRWEDAWRRGQRPDLDAYLADARAERLYLLHELVQADLEYRLQAGEEARIEAYPELRGDRAVALGLIASEYRLRRVREPGCGWERSVYRKWARSPCVFSATGG
jgi:hypothetical protein